MNVWRRGTLNPAPSAASGGTAGMACAVRDTVAGRRVAAYREEQLRDLLERVREGFVLYDLDQIDVLELDGLIVRYRHAAVLLRTFCGSEDLEWESAARDLALLHKRDEEPNWWGAAGLVAGRSPKSD